ncbi:plectin-like [Dryobates pubescens]|uniref:plectin-like n=1 Tax=Dryobates pubescens TaxID=118200 RepID=UPI0023B8ADC2|nr:plectin-like [Dryobates pubescens]
MRFHRLHNVQVALDYLKKHQVKLVNIRNDDITDGNPRLTLGLIWTIILHFQISNIHVTGESEDMSAKERLLLWSQQAAQGYAGMGCENFTTCWSNGRLFNAIIHKYSPFLSSWHLSIGRTGAELITKVQNCSTGKSHQLPHDLGPPYSSLYGFTLALEPTVSLVFVLGAL